LNQKYKHAGRRIIDGQPHNPWGVYPMLGESRNAANFFKVRRINEGTVCQCSGQKHF